MKRICCALVILLGLARIAHAAPVTVDATAAGADEVSLDTATVICDPQDAAVVKVAAGLLGDDVERVTGHKPVVATDAKMPADSAVLIGTLGQSPLIDGLVSSGKVDVTGLKGQWESFVWQTVVDPLPGIHKALVVIGSDRRGTAYGVVEISHKIGVSPWYWWADVPVAKHDHLRATPGRSVEKSPGIKYRGIFLNDEDFGLRPWATKTLDPGTGKMGPKTYEKIFELMLRLRLNYIWPAMHPGAGSSEFSTFPGNAECADKWAIVTGASHCEPMLRNNVFWPKSSGEWRYDVNHDNIFNYWKEAVTDRGQYESVWTLGIRGIHDAPMSGPKDIHERVKMVENCLTDQRSLIDQYVTKKYGPPAECFVPYKEVLPIYDAGMKVPDDVTLVWPDDNFGYIRRLATPDEKKRSGGSGVYYHVSYWGGPHSYLWVETNSPGLMWEELHKAYENDSKTLWVVNVGDIKPAEIAIDFYSKLAWDPAAWGPDAQKVFLKQFCDENFGASGPAVDDLLTEYYRLAAVRKPEHMAYGYAESMTTAQRAAMFTRYTALANREQEIRSNIPADASDAYFETVGYAAQMLAETGRMYCGDPAGMADCKARIDATTKAYNTTLAGGKWKNMMADAMEGLEWPPEVGGKLKPQKGPQKPPVDSTSVMIDAAAFTKSEGRPDVWTPVDGLGWSGRAITVLPANPPEAAQTIPPAVRYDFTTSAATSDDIQIHALPTMRMTTDGHLRIAVSIDGGAVQTLEVPGYDAGNENAGARKMGVQTNRVTMTFAAPNLPAGKHTLTITGVDRGVVLDQIELPAGAVVANLHSP
jgi:hypothetical protein